MAKSFFGGGALSAACALLSIFLTSNAAPSQFQTQQENPPTDNAETLSHETPRTTSAGVSLNQRIFETRPRTALAGNSGEASAQTFTATAYALRGRTASGRMVARGLIAADPRVLPLGTRVRVSAGSHSGEYTVADTGGAVRGRRIDIWVPSTSEAMRFGRRNVRLTVLQYGGSRRRLARAPIAFR